MLEASFKFAAALTGEFVWSEYKYFTTHSGGAIEWQELLVLTYQEINAL